MRARTSSNFCQIRLLVPMATDRVIMEKTVLPLFLSCFSSDPFILAGDDDMHESSTSSNFGQIRPRAAELWPLKDVRNWFLLNILRMDGQNLNKFCIHIIIDKIYIAIVKRHFSQICNRVTALIDVRNWFLLNILRMDGQNLTNFVYTLSLTRSMFVS